MADFSLGQGRIYNITVWARPLENFEKIEFEFIVLALSKQL